MKVTPSALVIAAEDPIQFDIQARNFSLTDAIRDHAEWRLRFASTCCDDYNQRAVMRLSDYR